jgi:hypothetical protein
MKSGHWGLLGVVVGLGVSWLALPDPPPTALTEAQKVAIAQKIHTEIMHGQMLYNLPELIPPAVSFAVLDPRNAAESLCQYKLVSDGVPAWSININQRMAARNYHAVMRSTIPHEVAHLLRCQFDAHWQDHDARWQTIVRDMGSVPVERHDYGQE